MVNEDMKGEIYEKDFYEECGFPDGIRYGAWWSDRQPPIPVPRMLVNQVTGPEKLQQEEKARLPMPLQVIREPM